jgi:hypothetical protein
MVDAPIPLPHMAGHMARNKAMNAAKDELRNKLDTKDYDRGFRREPTPEDEIQKLIRDNPRLPKPTMAEQETSAADQVRKIKKAGSLSIVSSDHAIEDSPNAGHVNENIGRSVAMTAVKTIGKRKGITDGNSRPLGKRMKRRYIYEGIDISEQVSFGKEFDAARMRGDAEFDFKGKKYSTMKKGESQDQWKANLKKPEAPVPMARDARPQNVVGQNQFAGTSSSSSPGGTAAATRSVTQNPANVKSYVGGLRVPKGPTINPRDLGSTPEGPVAGTYRDANQISPQDKADQDAAYADRIADAEAQETAKAVEMDAYVKKPPRADAEPSLQVGLNRLADKFKQNLVKENENEIADGSDTDNSPKEKKNKMEKRGNLVTVNPKLNDDK